MERANSKGNFSDLRAELVDHYVNELGDHMSIESGTLFRQKVIEYHDKFGGPKKITEIANNFFKTKNRLIKGQFGKWLLEYWPVHLALSPLVFYTFISVDFNVLLISLIAMITLICCYEGFKYLRNRRIRAQIKNGDSAINFFFLMKLEIFSLAFLPMHFLNIDESGIFTWINYFIVLSGLYFIPWLYYYHINVCRKRIEPLLQHYKMQLI